jgi:hypothetical protein
MKPVEKVNIWPFFVVTPSANGCDYYSYIRVKSKRGKWKLTLMRKTYIGKPDIFHAQDFIYYCHLTFVAYIPTDIKDTEGFLLNPVDINQKSELERLLSINES